MAPLFGCHVRTDRSDAAAGGRLRVLPLGMLNSSRLAGPVLAGEHMEDGAGFRRGTPLAGPEAAELLDMREVSRDSAGKVLQPAIAGAEEHMRNLDLPDDLPALQQTRSAVEHVQIPVLDSDPDESHVGRRNTEALHPRVQRQWGHLLTFPALPTTQSHRAGRSGNGDPLGQEPSFEAVVQSVADQAQIVALVRLGRAGVREVAQHDARDRGRSHAGADVEHDSTNGEPADARKVVERQLGARQESPRTRIGGIRRDGPVQSREGHAADIGRQVAVAPAGRGSCIVAGNRREVSGTFGGGRRHAESACGLDGDRQLRQLQAALARGPSRELRLGPPQADHVVAQQPHEAVALPVFGREPFVPRIDLAAEFLEPGRRRRVAARARPLRVQEAVADPALTVDVRGARQTRRGQQPTEQSSCQLPGHRVNSAGWGR
ncbi:MAG: hypothetical protein HY655_05035 [Acidobacteria bacterium]|nr:hypothetical protein [Acidobacteriota bacterium]